MADAAREVRRSFGLRISVALLGLLAAFAMTVLAVRTLSASEATTFLAILAALMVGPMLGRLGLGQSLIRVLAGARSSDVASAQIKGHLRATVLLSLVSAPVVAWLAALGAERSRGAVWAVVTVLVVAETLRLTLSDVYGKPEFNNIGGVATPFVDLGLPGGLVYYVTAGLICGVLYRAYQEGRPLGLLLYRWPRSP